jgi:Concanavalin A-like lectin/glucanases superfamily/Fibronectin type III domain/Divergent InlB B-repeat domain
MFANHKTFQPMWSTQKAICRRLKLSGCAIPNTVQRLKSRKDLIMNKNPLFSARPSSGAKFRNLQAASWSRLLGAVASLLVIALSPCLAVQSCTLAWDASSDSAIAGYKLRYGTTSGNPSQSIDVGKSTTRTVSNLNDATTYYFTVVAYNTAGVDSQPSNQVSYTTPGGSSSGYVLTVTNGTGDGTYAPASQVPVSANPPAAGQVFATWTGDYQILANPSSPTTTATMPSLNATITATYKAASAPTNQVTALSFSEGSGTSAADSSGSDHDGTLVNGPSWTAGKFGNGLSLDGNNQCVLVENPNTLNLGTSDFTIAAWIKRQATGEEFTIVCKTAWNSWTTGSKEFFINGSDGKLAFGIYGAGQAFATSAIPDDGSWHHVAITFANSSNTLSFYIDGIASGTNTLNPPADVDGHVIIIGGHPHQHYFQGQLDEFRIFSRALSPSEVQSIMNNAIPPAQP